MRMLDRTASQFWPSVPVASKRMAVMRYADGSVNRDNAIELVWGGGRIT